MANKNRGEVDIILNKHKYVMRPTFQALCEIENDLDKSLFSIIEESNNNVMPLKNMVSIIKNGINANGKYDLQEDEIGEAIMQASIIKIIPKIYQFLSQAVGIK
jgi:hypothetical protein